MFKRIYVSLLTLALLFNTSFASIPFGSSNNKAYADKDNKKVEIPRTVEKVKEIEEAREPNTKTFLNSDGTYTKEIYTEDIHYEDEGKLQNISNTPVLNAEDDKEEFKYTNKNNRYSVKFARDSKKKNLYKIRLGEEVTEFKLLNTLKAKATSEEGLIRYENILKNVDVQYSIGNSNVKEDIFLKTNDSVRTFEFLISGTLVPKKEGKSINFYNKQNQIVWTVIPPFMEDANGKYSEDIEVEIKSDKKGYILTLTPDEKFLDAKDTVYPVRIDPTVNIGGASSNTLDTYVMSMYSSNNYYSTPELRNGYTSSTGTTRTYMDFTQSLPNLTGKLLVKAELKLYKWNDIGTVSPTNIYANRITGPWDSTNVTYRTQPGIDTTKSYGTTSATGAARWIGVDLTDLVDGWMKGTVPNYGVVLRNTGETSAGSYQKFNASETASNKPYLAITYSDPPTGLSATPYSNGDSTGYVDLRWNPVDGATGYKVQIYNGRTYEAFNVGNTTSWSTRGKKLWPTRAQIDSGQFGLRTAGDGRELPENPSYLYMKSGGVYPSNTNYWFRVTAYNKYGETDIWANGVVPNIPDQTKPTPPTAVQVTNDRVDSFTIGWQPATDLEGSGVANYRVFMGDQPGIPNLVNGTLTSNTFFTYSETLTPRKTYYAWVQAIDKSSNISNNSVSAEKVARKEFDAQIESYYIPSTSNIDNTLGESLWFDVRNTGTAAWTNDLNINLSLTSTNPDGTPPNGFVGYLNTGEVIKPNEVKRFYVNWKPKTALIGTYGIKAVVGKGTNPTYINPPENIISQSINVKDLKAPTGKVTINDNRKYTTQTNVILNVFDVYDNANGEKYVQFANGPESATASTLQFSPSNLVPQSSGTFNWTIPDKEGPQFVYARFLDKSGNISELYHDSIIYDKTLPDISVSNIKSGEYVSGKKSITGSVTDQDLASFKIEYRNKSDVNGVWNLIATQQTSIIDGTLGEWDTTSLPKGEYEIRVSATDAAGQTNMVLIPVWVDTVDKTWTGVESFYPTYPLNLLSGSGSVNLFNGSLNIQEVDFTLSSRAFSLAAGRTYSSNLNQKGLLGKGWVTNLEERLVLGTNYVDYLDADGSTHRFNKQADGSYSIPSGTSFNLTYNNSTTGYELTQRNGNLVTKTFNNKGQIQKIVDTNGNILDYQYQNGILQKIVSLNKSLSLTYNTDNQIQSITFSTGDKVTYDYSNGLLTDVKVYSKNGTIMTYTHYDYKDGKMSAVVAENGHKVELGFNGNRLIQVKTSRSTRLVDGTKLYPLKKYEEVSDTLSYNLNTNKVYATTNSLNANKTNKNLANIEFELNSQGNIWKTNTIRTYSENEDPDAAKADSNNILVVTEYDQNQLKSITDGLGNKTSYEYDTYGNMLKKYLPTVTSNGVKSNYSLAYKYNSRGQQTHAYNTVGQVKEWKYDEKGNLLQVIDEGGNKQVLEYDSYGNIKKKINERGPLYSYLADYSMENKVLTDWKIQGTAVKSTAYSKSGKQSMELSPGGSIQTSKVSIKKGRLPIKALLEGMAPTDTPSVEVKLHFYKDDLVIKEYTQLNPTTATWSKISVNGEVPTDATHVSVLVTNKGTSKLYIDDLVLEESNLVTSYVYDETGENVKEVIDSYGNKTSYTYDIYGNPLTETNALNQTQSITYDDQQRPTMKKDRAGRLTNYEYDSMDNVIKETNSLGQATTYEYNEWGQLLHTTQPTVKMTYYKDEMVDKVEEKQVHLYIEYDELGRKVKENDENGNVIAQEFDGYGRLARSIDPMQNQKYFSYDKNGNILHTIDYAAKASPESQEKLLIAKGEMYATYNEWNQQITETDNTGNRNVLTMVNTFDSEGRLVHTRDAEGTEFNYTFNALGENIYTKDNSTPVVESWTYYDGLGNAAITLSGSTLEFSVNDANGNLLETVDHKGTRTKYQYNEVGDKIKQTNPDGTTVEWTYNPDGQILTETQKVEEKDNNETFLITTYEYNNAAEVIKKRLESKVVNKGTNETTTLPVRDTNLTYDELGRVVRELSKVYTDDPVQTKTSDIRFLYDLNGNLIRKWVYDETSKTVINYGASTYPFVRSSSIYQYDANNRFTYEEKLENGVVTRKTYKDDENAEMIQSALGTTTVQYNENDLAGKVITPRSEEYLFQYTASENINTIKGPRLTVNMDYGLNQKMTAIQAKKKDTTTVLFSENYTYNGEEQIETATNPWDGQKAYTYTPEGFLKTVKKGTGTITYTYDTSGNLLKAINESGKVLTENIYGPGNRITSSIQFDQSIQKYRKVAYSFRPDGSLLKETISKVADTYETAKTATVEVEKDYHYASINLLLGITTKTNGTVSEKIEFTYDSEDNRTSKKVTNANGERTEFYYYDANGDLVSISEKSGIDPVQNLMNFYRDANGQLLSFEYKGKIYDYVYNQRGDIVAITNELQEIVARYTYDEWGNQLSIDAPTPLGAEVAKANPYRYVGKFGVQYDKDTKLYFMGWRDYDSKIGRYLVADEYEGDDNNPISFNRYLYAESDPVNNIDPDGYAPKWLKKITKGVKKASKAVYNYAIGDDIKTLKSKNTKWYQKAGAAVMIASNFVPGGGVASKVAKAAIKGASKAVKAVKASKTVTKTAKVIRTTAKKTVAAVNKKPKTVPAPSIKSSPKIETTAPAKVIQTPEFKLTVGRSVSQSRVERTFALENTPVAGDNIGINLRPKGTVKTEKQTLYHYTSEEGLKGITSSNKLNPSLKANNPKDARHGDGQYLTDIAPGSKTSGQLSRQFFGIPFLTKRVSHYIEIDVSGLNVVKGRDGVHLVPNDNPLDLSGRIVRTGKN